MSIPNARPLERRPIHPGEILREEFLPDYDLSVTALAEAAFGLYRYPLASGGFGESCATGFAVRGKELAVYLVAEAPDQASLLATLGKHKFGTACLYFKRLADLDQKVLEQLVLGSLAELKRRYG